MPKGMSPKRPKVKSSKPYPPPPKRGEMMKGIKGYQRHMRKMHEK